ncbi:MAG: glycosyltransferase, partial [Candidatus Omnitrophica bacterium]|nr:glycosyltransferase [Candidatus Omnitrophota bacterium]
LKILFLKKILDIINVFFSSKGILFGYARCPTFSDQWFFSAYRKAKNIIKEKKIDVIITSFPPPVVNVLGYRLKKKFKNILWIQDFRDPWVRNTMHKGIWPFNFLEKYLERKSCKNADIITVVSDIWADWFKVDYSSKLKNIFVIKNGYDKESVDNIVSCSNHDEFIKVNEKKNLLHIGSLYKINDNIELIFRAIEEGRFQFEEYLRIVFYGAYETFAFLNGYMERYPKAKRIVQYKGFLSAEEVLRKESQADAFLLMKNNKNDGVIPMKVFEYMAFKKPIIGVCLTQSSYLGDILKKTGLGVFCGGDISRIEEALILVSTGEVKISPNNDFIEGFSREAQVKNLNYIIESRLNWGGFLSSSK